MPEAPTGASGSTKDLLRDDRTLVRERRRRWYGLRTVGPVRHVPPAAARGAGPVADPTTPATTGCAPRAYRGPMPESPSVPPLEAVETPLLRRIRESVIGDDQVMHGPYGPRRVTYADYTASGRALDLHRGLHPRRGAAALRQHPHRVQRHRPADHPAARGRPRGSSATRSAATTTPSSSSAGSGCDRRDRQADRHPRPAHPGRPRRPLRPDRRRSRRTSGRWCSSARSSTTPTSCPWRESIADVVTIPEDADGHIDLDAARERARASTPTGRCKIGSFSAASQRHRHRHRHRTRIADAAAPRTARCRSGTSPPRRRTSTSR